MEGLVRDAYRHSEFAPGDLGHADVSTTEIYARADPETKRKAIESAYQSLTPEPLPSWTADRNLLEWLDRVCR